MSLDVIQNQMTHLKTEIGKPPEQLNKSFQ